MPLWAPLMCLVASWRNWGSTMQQNVQSYWIVKYFVSIVHLCLLSICWYFLRFSVIAAIRLGTASYSDLRWFNLSAFTTTDMHWFAFISGWPIDYRGNTFFRVGPNISEKIRSGEPILGVPESKLNVTDVCSRGSVFSGAYGIHSYMQLSGTAACV